MVLPAFGKMREKSGKVTRPVWAIPRDLFQKKQKDSVASVRLQI